MPLGAMQGPDSFSQPDFTFGLNSCTSIRDVTSQVHGPMTNRPGSVVNLDVHDRLTAFCCAGPTQLLSGLMAICKKSVKITSRAVAARKVEAVSQCIPQLSAKKFGSTCG